MDNVNWFRKKKAQADETIIDVDSVDPLDEDIKMDPDAELLEGLRRSVMHTKGSSPPPSPTGAKSSNWREGGSPSKKARAQDAQGGDEYGTPEGSLNPQDEGQGGDETARYSPAFETHPLPDRLTVNPALRARFSFFAPQPPRRVSRRWPCRRRRR